MPTRIVHVKPSTLKMPEYQRTRDENRVAKIAATFDPAKLGAITVVRRSNDDLLIADGSHRVGGCLKAGYDDPVLAIEHYDIPLKEEAALFLGLNNTKQVSAVDRFQAAVIAEDPEAVSINDIINAYGWSIQKYAADGTMRAVAGLTNVYRGTKFGAAESGPKLLVATIEMITQAWGHQVAGSDKQIIEGIGKLLAKYGDELNRKRVLSLLKKTTPEGLLARGRSRADVMRHTTSSGVAGEIVAMYNTKLRGERLTEWVWK